jgi:hypothetical protein
MDVAMIAGLGIIAYFAYKLFGGSSDNAQNNATTQQNTAAANAADTAKSNAAGIAPTYDQATLSGLADQVYTLAVTNSDYSNSQAIKDAIIQCNNIADWNALKGYYGTRKMAVGYFNTCYALGFNCDSLDIFQTVKISCTDQDRADMTSFFMNTGMPGVVF